MNTPSNVLPFPAPSRPAKADKYAELARLLEHVASTPGAWRQAATEIDRAATTGDKRSLDALGMICTAFLIHWSTLTPTELAAQIFSAR